MQWREALYCAFPDSFEWKGKSLSQDEINDLHEYAVFLRSRIGMLRTADQLRSLGLLLENLMDTYEWDPRDADTFLEWLNPFNDYRGPQYDILDEALRLAEELLEGEGEVEQEVPSLLSLLDTLPHFSEGRLAFFAQLNDLQRFAVWLWLREFTVRYGNKMDWVARTEAAMARFYWDDIAKRLDGASLEKWGAEYLKGISRSVLSWSWDRSACLRETVQVAPSFFWMRCAGETPSVALFLDETLMRPMRGELSEQVESGFPLYGRMISSRTELPDCLDVWLRPGQLHSPRLRDILFQLGLAQKVRYLPVHLMDEATHQEITLYYLALYQNKFSCLSRKRTIGFWDTSFRHVTDLHRPALVRSQIEGELLFVAIEDENLVVVSEEVKKGIEAALIRGLEFVRLLVVEE